MLFSISANGTEYLRVRQRHNYYLLTISLQGEGQNEENKQNKPKTNDIQSDSTFSFSLKYHNSVINSKQENIILNLLTNI